MKNTIMKGRRLLVGAVALALGASACIPMPPNTFTPEQFAIGQGPNIVRAQVFQGLGAWWDVWDWSPTFIGGTPGVGLGDINQMAAEGVQTLYIQTASYRRADDVLDPALLRQIIARARSKGIRVVGWYLPEHVDEALDNRRMEAAIRLGFDGFGIDIESSKNPDVGARSAMLIRQTKRLRQLFPNLPLAAIPVAPIVWEELNHTWWPNFPYVELSKYFDAWMPQNYWTFRSESSGLKDAYVYNVRNIEMLRRKTGVAWLPVHPIGGLAEATSKEDIALMAKAIRDTHSIGGSLYDYKSTPKSLTDALGLFRIPK